MPVCDKCYEKLPPENDFVVCNGCNSKIHYLCAGIRETKWKTSNNEWKMSWRCITCKSKIEDSTKENQAATTQMQNETAASLGEMIRRIIKEENREIISEMKDFQKSMEFYSNQLDEFTKVVKKLTDENTKLIKKQEELEVRCGKLEKDNQELKTAIEEDRQYNRNHNLIIDGVPETQGENLVNLVLQLAKKVQVSVLAGDIQAVHRIPSANNKKPIVVQFVNRMTRDNILEKSKSTRPTLKDVYPNQLATALYVNEHMTPYYKRLMYLAKQKQTENQKAYKYVWFKNSKLFARKTENSPILRIRCEKEI